MHNADWIKSLFVIIHYLYHECNDYFVHSILLVIRRYGHLPAPCRKTAPLPLLYCQYRTKMPVYKRKTGGKPAGLCQYFFRVWKVIKNTGTYHSTRYSKMFFGVRAVTVNRNAR